MEAKNKTSRKPITDQEWKNLQFIINVCLMAEASKDPLLKSRLEKLRERNSKK